MCTLTQVGDLPRLAYLLEIKRAQPSSCAVRPGAVIGLGLGVKAFWYLGDLLIEAAKSIGWKAALPFPPRGRPNLRRRDFQGTTAQRGVLIMPIGGADNADSGTDRAVKGSDNADRGTVSLTDTADRGTESADTPTCHAATRDSSRPQPTQGVLTTLLRGACSKRYAPHEHAPYNTRRATRSTSAVPNGSAALLSAPSARRRDAPAAALPRPYLPSARWSIARRTPPDGSARATALPSPR